MQVTVSDSSVLIDLAKARLVESAFTLPYEFTVPDVMFAEELLNLGHYTRHDLLNAGLEVRGFEGEDVDVALGYVRRYVA